MTGKVILLINLGSPDSPLVKDVRRYLDEFLMDERVIDLPYVTRYLLVKGLIVPLRARASSRKYKAIWTEKGSPLLINTGSLASKLGAVTGLPVVTCMRYANPTPELALKSIQEKYPDTREVVLVPLYPHYTLSSFETAVKHVAESYNRGRYKFQLNVVQPFFDNKQYINALSNQIRPFLQTKHDHILFSYHGIPVRHIFKGDITSKHCLKMPGCCESRSIAHSKCYLHQVKVTTRLLVDELGIPGERFSIAFQSRLGSDRWLSPSTSAVLQSLPNRGAKSILVVCPSFVSDCLETLEEIDVEGREIFTKAGGVSFTLIPCLNDSSDWVNALASIIAIET